MQVFPIKKELLHPQEEMERHITDLIKKVNPLAFMIGEVLVARKFIPCSCILDLFLGKELYMFKLEYL